MFEANRKLHYKSKTFVEINGIKGDVGIVEYGVPQGGVLGPLPLFKLYLCDISNLELFGESVMFADVVCIHTIMKLF